MTDNTLKNKGTNAFVKHYPLSRDRFANYRRSTSEELLGVWRMYSHLPAWRRSETFLRCPYIAEPIDPRNLPPKDTLELLRTHQYQRKEHHHGK